jgi:hypothetical protein
VLEIVTVPATLCLRTECVHRVLKKFAAVCFCCCSVSRAQQQAAAAAAGGFKGRGAPQGDFMQE